MDSFIALIIGLALGVGFYYYDIKKGTKAYVKWYNLTHKDKYNSPVQRGFVFNQPFSGRITPAIFISAVIAVLFYITGNMNPISILLYGAVMFVGLMAAFYLSPFMFKNVPEQLERISKAIEKVDELEAELKNEKNEESPEPEIEKQEDPQDENEKKPDSDDDKDKGDDWRSGVKDFLDK